MPNTPLRLLLVEDEEDFRDSCARWLGRKGHHVTAVSNGAEAITVCESLQFDVAVFDLNLPGMSGLELLHRIQKEKVEMEVIFLTGQGSIESAVSAMKMGACDYLTKPCSLGDLEHHCELAFDRGRLRKENRQLKAVISRQQPAAQLIGQSAAMQDVGRMIEKVAPTDKPVLIQGESGTGKEVVARAIQQASALSEKPFVTINCAALPEQLVESELFGHIKGSFTGASADKPGLFEIADGGTLFIDEIGELPPSLQPKLLRVLEDGSMRRIGCHKERHVRVRIIAATNRDLQNEVREGRFREDLYYRINVLSLNLPPLRDREGDVERLIAYFLPAQFHLHPAAREAMTRYHWPGNVRQLINVIQRATILADANEIVMSDLPAEVINRTDGPLGQGMGRTAVAGVAGSGVAGSGTTSSGIAGASFASMGNSRNLPTAKLDDIAKAHVLEVLANENGNKARAARKLGIHRRKLYRLLERFDKEERTSEALQSECS
jgi:DNA-binding NtrC family response regulator